MVVASARPQQPPRRVRRVRRVEGRVHELDGEREEYRRQVEPPQT